MNAYAVGGTIRATFTSAAALARRHDVEIVSVLRTAREPELPLDPAVRLRPLTELRETKRREAAKVEGLPARVRTGSSEWALAQRSRLMHPQDARYENFNLASDASLLRFLRSTRDGVLVGTRPAINLAMARFAQPSVVRVGQDHMNLGRYDPDLKEAMADAYPRLDALVALTERTAEDYRRLLRAPTRVEAIPNGVRNLSGVRAQLEAPVVASAGRMTGQKGFDRLLPVWARVAPEHPDWELRIFGDGQRENKLRRQIRDLGLEGRAWLMGRTTELPAELAASSLYAMTSRFEGFPMVLLEAMSVGLPVVSYDIETGPAEVVDNGVDGYVVPDGDEAALAAAMAELMGDPDKRRRFGAAALEKAARYDTDAVLARFERLLEELVEAKQAEPGSRIPEGVAAAARRPLEAARGFRGKDSLNAALAQVTGYQLVKPESIRREARKEQKRKKRAPKPRAAIPDHYDDEAREVIRAVRDWTMTSHEKLFALIVATRYVVDQRIPGDVVECGVWRGGSMQAVARTLLARGAADRDLHLFDTFEGMPPPSEVDRRHDGAPAAELLATRTKDAKVWAIASLDDVRAGMAQTGYPEELVHFHPGLVEHTIPGEVPDEIALLRLDTDWYDSTRHELEHLYERVPSGGVILLDDYGYWEGARQAVDEFVDQTGVRLLLVPMGSGRIAVKP